MGGGIPLKVDYERNLKVLAFTLAEVLVTLGLIGVVAAITLSSVIKTYQKKVAVAQLQKVYSQLNQVFKTIVDDPGIDVLSGNPKDFVPLYIAPLYTNAIVYPPNSDHTKAMCFDEKEYYYGGQNKTAQYASTNVKGGSVSYISTPFYPKMTTSIKLMDGTCIGFNKLYKSTIYPESTIFVDINGSNKPPNRLCRDLFWFYLDQEKHIMLPTEKIGNYDFAKIKCGAKKIIDAGWEIDETYTW